jgi:hypothetical protein
MDNIIEVLVMPLQIIEIVEGKGDTVINDILAAVHRSVIEAFNVPESDRYQIVHENKSIFFKMDDTGLGFNRTEDRLILRIITSPRTEVQKKLFYKTVCENLFLGCGIHSENVMVSIVTNTKEDWSFGKGRAQFIIGDL